MNGSYQLVFEKFSKPIIAGQDAGGYPYGAPFEFKQSATSTLAGNQVLMLTSNNYLGLAADPRVENAAIEAIENFGVSTCGARLHNGTTTLHRTLEKSLAQWLGYEDSVLFGSGFVTNVGVLGALGSPQTVIISDNQNHGSVRAGYQQNGSTVRLFTHNDLEKLEYVLKEAQRFSRRVVIVEGVYSMTGDKAPLQEISSLCQEYDALLVVDDAHGIGVIGDTGRGSVEDSGVRPDLLIGTLSKSFGSYGGFVVGSLSAVEFIRHQADAAVLTAALPAALVGAALKSLEIIKSEPEHRVKLWRNTMLIRQGLADLGFEIEEEPSPIIPLKIGDESKVMALSMRLRARGVFLSPAVYPAVQKGKSIMRITSTAMFSPEDIEFALRQIDEADSETGESARVQF